MRIGDVINDIIDPRVFELVSVSAPGELVEEMWGTITDRLYNDRDTQSGVEIGDFLNIPIPASIEGVVCFRRIE